MKETEVRAWLLGLDTLGQLVTIFLVYRVFIPLCQGRHTA